MTKMEKETIINWNEKEEMVSVYTTSPAVWRRCQKLGFREVNVEKFENGRIASKKFECPKRCILIRKVPAKRKLSEEGRVRARARLENVRSRSSIGEINEEKGG